MTENSRRDSVSLQRLYFDLGQIRFDGMLVKFVHQKPNEGGAPWKPQWPNPKARRTSTAGVVFNPVLGHPPSTCAISLPGMLRRIPATKNFWPGHRSAPRRS